MPAPLLLFGFVRAEVLSWARFGFCGKSARLGCRGVVFIGIVCKWHS